MKVSPYSILFVAALLAWGVDGLVTFRSAAKPTTVAKPRPHPHFRTSFASTTPRNTPTQLNTVSFPIEVATCLLPTCGGFVSREFGVSYAYGAATSLTALVVLKQHIRPVTTSLWKQWQTWHAAALVFYGIRLSLFLFYRQKTSKRIQEMRKRIEQRAESSGSRLSRTPFVLSCAYLYYGLCAPLYQTAGLLTTKLSPTALVAFRTLVALTWTGFGMAALGDFAKSTVKARRGEDHLVTGGIFRIVRHPNYTGEMIGWTSSSAAGLLAFIVQQSFTQVKAWWYLASNLLGVMGINFVLMLATRNLEKRQAEMYGDTEAYQEWVEKSWGGWTLPEKEVHQEPHIEVSDTNEDDGSGI